MQTVYIVALEAVHIVTILLKHLAPIKLAYNAACQCVFFFCLVLVQHFLLKTVIVKEEE